MTRSDEQLVAIFERARARGYLGPGPVRPHLDHARGFAVLAEAVLGRPPASVVDLGSGGGLPGLVLAVAWPAAQVTLIDAAHRRTEDLAAAVEELAIAPRVRVVEARAETAAHLPDLRESAELVTARSFGAPALVAEVASGFVVPGGWLIVSEPPGGSLGRWPEAPLAGFGFGPAEVREAGGSSYVVVRKRAGAPPEAPRATRRLVKRPAW